MLMRFEPFREIDRLTQLWGQSRLGAMPLDAYRQGERFVVQLDLPGADPSTIDLTIEKNVLTVRAERQAPTAEGAEWLVNERPQGSFSRQLFLGEGLDTERVEATYDHGVLIVTDPVAEAAKPRRVEISAGAGDKAIQANSEESGTAHAA